MSEQKLKGFNKTKIKFYFLGYRLCHYFLKNYFSHPAIAKRFNMSRATVSKYMKNGYIK
jgi:hypothetical protein